MGGKATCDLSWPGGNRQFIKVAAVIPFLMTDYGKGRRGLASLDLVDDTGTRRSRDV